MNGFTDLLILRLDKFLQGAKVLGDPYKLIIIIHEDVDLGNISRVVDFLKEFGDTLIVVCIEKFIFLDQSLAEVWGVLKGCEVLLILEPDVLE